MNFHISHKNKSAQKGQ